MKSAYETESWLPIPPSIETVAVMADELAARDVTPSPPARCSSAAQPQAAPGSVVAVAQSYEEIVAAIGTRRQELRLSQLAVDEIAGLQTGYTGKIECGDGGKAVELRQRRRRHLKPRLSKSPGCQKSGQISRVRLRSPTSRRPFYPSPLSLGPASAEAADGRGRFQETTCAGPIQCPKTECRLPIAYRSCRFPEATPNLRA